MQIFHFFDPNIKGRIELEAIMKIKRCGECVFEYIFLSFMQRH